MKNNRTRSIYYIDHEVQAGLLRRLAVYWIASILFITLPLALIKTVTQPNVFFLDHLADVFYFHWPLLGMLALFLPMAMNDFVKFSNRFAGPVYRMRTELNKFGSGPVPRIKLRENDYWHDLADSINRVTARLNELEQTVSGSEDESELDESSLAARNS